MTELRSGIWAPLLSCSWWYHLIRTTVSPVARAQKVHSPNLLKRKCVSEVVRISSKIIIHLSKLWKAKFPILGVLYFLWGCRGNLKVITLGSERVVAVPGAFCPRSGFFITPINLPMAVTPFYPYPGQSGSILVVVIFQVGEVLQKTDVVDWRFDGAIGPFCRAVIGSSY